MKLVLLVETNPGRQMSMLSTFVSGSPSLPFSYAFDGLYSSGDFDTEPGMIVDSGFQITTPLHSYFKHSPLANDVWALVNTLGLFVMLWYPAKTVFWDADYTLVFRAVTCQLFRAFCATFTFLPPSDEFLPSYFDFPEALYCGMGADCSDSALSAWMNGREYTKVRESGPPEMPFLTFFSGHVAMAVIVANHMYIRGYVKWAVAVHALNVVQIVRLLATRGHYSIDLIMGWIVAVYVTNPAERLGRHYSRWQTNAEISEHLSALSSEEAKTNLKHILEELAGVTDIQLGTRSSEPLATGEGSAKILSKYLSGRSERLAEVREIFRNMTRNEILQLAKDARHDIGEKIGAAGDRIGAAISNIDPTRTRSESRGRSKSRGRGKGKNNN